MNYDQLISKQILWPDREAQPGRKQMVVFTNCTGRALGEYLRRNKDFRAQYNIDVLETGPIQLALSDGVPVFTLGSIVRLFEGCDVLVTNNMGPRHREMALENFRPMLRGRLITFVAPNFSCLWPLCYGFSGMIGVERLLDAGSTVEEVWRKIKDGSFDPEFNLRWRLEMGKLTDKAAYHDIDIHHFIAVNIRKVKLFTAGSHPTYHVVAHIGARVLDLLGIGHESEADNLAHDCMDMTMRGQPESSYEWSHYKYEYQLSNDATVKEFDEWYLPMLHEAAGWWQRGALMMPPRD